MFKQLMLLLKWCQWLLGSQGPLPMTALYSIQNTKSDNKARIDDVNMPLCHRAGKHTRINMNM